MKSQSLSESKESLWILTVSPALWAAHFLLCYITAAVWCAKHGGDASLAPVRIAMAVYTVAALLGILWNGWVGYSRHKLGDSEIPHDADTPEDRHRFLGFATFLLSLLSGVAVLYAALVAIFIWDCH